MTNLYLYLFTFSAALILSVVLTPAARSAAIIYDIFDHPSSAVKTHKIPVPYLGGLAIFISFSFYLILPGALNLTEASSSTKIQSRLSPGVGVLKF